MHETRRTLTYEWGILIFALLLLLIGVLVYFLDRPAGSAYFLPMAVTYNLGLFGSVGNHIPTFVHVFAFILLSAIFVVPSKQSYALVTSFWLAIDIIFEVAQHSIISSWIESVLPNWFQELPFIKGVIRHFVVSTYDIYDIYSIILGAVFAFLTLMIIQHKRDKNVFFK